MNPFMVWSQLERRKIIQSFPDSHNAEISKNLGRKWRSLTEEQRRPFVEEADRLKVLHIKEFPQYKYQPKKRPRMMKTTTVMEKKSEPLKIRMVRNSNTRLTACELRGHKNAKKEAIGERVRAEVFGQKSESQQGYRQMKLGAIAEPTIVHIKDEQEEEEETEEKVKLEREEREEREATLQSLLMPDLTESVVEMKVEEAGGFEDMAVEEGERFDCLATLTELELVAALPPGEADLPCLVSPPSSILPFSSSHTNNFPSMQANYIPACQDTDPWEEESVESGYHSPDYPHLQFDYDDIFTHICL